MEVALRHLGYMRLSLEDEEDEYKHVYSGNSIDGWVGTVLDDDFVRDGIYNLPDDMYSFDSGEVNWMCDSCDLQFTTQSRPGGIVTCPRCGEVGHVPEGVVLNG